MSATPPAPSTIGVGVIGLGFIGATHIRAFQAAECDGFPCRLVAVADRRAERLSGRADTSANLGVCIGDQLFDRELVRGYTDASQLICDPRIQLVSICTHTDTHVDLACAALRAGKHVLVEKPISLAVSEVRQLAQVAAQSKTLCMAAMCMRFWPEWAWIRDRVKDGSLGHVKSAVFQRLGAPPEWAEFYRDVSKSGGSLVDLHIHDADFIRWCFGMPQEVVSIGSLMHVTTLYRYPAATGPEHVMSEGGQDHTPGFGYRQRCVVVFEKATVDFDLARTPQLAICRDGKSEAVTMPIGTPSTGYDVEVRYILNAIMAKTPAKDLLATIADSVDTTRLLDAERKSLETKAPVRLG